MKDFSVQHRLEYQLAPFKQVYPNKLTFLSTLSINRTPGRSRGSFFCGISSKHSSVFLSGDNLITSPFQLRFFHLIMTTFSSLYCKFGKLNFFLLLD